MAKVYASIDRRLADFCESSPVFFVATAPTDGGHVNVSPKGLDTFRVLGPREVAYLDLSGSGIETVSHLRADGRITLMFCAFSGPPTIVRLHGTGEAVLRDDPAFAALAKRFPPLPGQRSIIRVDVERISDSCGYAVPLMTFEGPREVLTKHHERKGEDALAVARARQNAESIDGLPGLPVTGGRA
jgi:hypothetical protein